jgi:hypothetical protein
MGHPEIENRTPFAAEALFMQDEEGRALVVPVVKATYAIGRGKLQLADHQRPVNGAGEFWGEPGQSSYKYEPEVAFVKPATDVALLGHGYPPKGVATELLVTLRVGPLEKRVRVIGDRHWTKSVVGTTASKPTPFERLPLVWERAFGGWDRSNADPAKHAFEPRNPVGTGFRSKHGRFEEGTRLPNLEDPERPLKSHGDSPPPAGFGFIAPHWQPRARFAGTYDDAWSRQRKPLLPMDFDRRFFNAAAPGLVAPGFLRGDEPVAVENASRVGTLRFALPGVPAPAARVRMRTGEQPSVPTHLDTVIINTDEEVVFLLWRAHVVVRGGPHRVGTIELLPGAAS